jgi:TP901 family phage tail tape measure protein
MLLIIRARDEASKVLAGLGANMAVVDAETKQAATSTRAHGAALTTIGAVSTVVGVKLAKFYTDSANMAVKYNNEAARTLTQVDQAGVKVSDLAAIAERVGNKIPAPFEEMQSSLYDIFSSMDVNTKQSEALLTTFSKAAVAGQFDLQGAARGSIGIMNAFGLSVKDAGHVEDVMFELTKKGVGTYGDFTSAIGRATPSAVKAGQSYEELAGMMAFLTRNGLSTASASASAARALDAMSNPATEAHMKDLGLTVKNAQGQFKPMTQIIQEMSDKLKGMTKPEQAEALKDIFKGSGGTIQAMRFFNVAMTQTGQYTKLTSDIVNNSSGQMDKAYKIMFKQPQTQMQLLNNQWKIMRTELGEAFIPSVNKLIAVGSKLLGWFNNLSPHTKRLIAEIGLITAALLIFGGIIMVIVGTFLIFSAAAATAGIGLGAIALTIGVVILAVAALGAAVYFIIKYWGPITDFFKALWKDVKAIFWDAYNWVMTTGLAWIKQYIGMLQTLWDWLVTNTEAAWTTVEGAFTTAYDSVLSFTSAFWDDVKKYWSDGVSAVEGFFSPITQWFQSHWDEIKQVFWVAEQVIADGLRTMWAILVAMWTLEFAVIKAGVIVTWDIIKTVFSIAWAAIVMVTKQAWDIISTYFKISWAIIVAATTLAWDAIVLIFKVSLAILEAVVKIAWDAIILIWKIAWDTAVAIVKAVWVVISGEVKIALNLLALIFGVALDLITGHWSKAWDDIKKYGLAILNDFIAIFKSLWNIFVNWFAGSLAAILQFFTNSFKAIWDAGKTIFKAFITWLKDNWTTLWNTMKTILSDGWSGLSSFFKNGFKGLKTIWDTFWGGLSKTFTDMWTGIKSVATAAWSGLKGIFTAGANDVRDVLNWFIDAVNKIPGVPNIPKIPKFGGGGSSKNTKQQLGGTVVKKGNTVGENAMGGGIAGGSWSWVGERGPELIHVTKGQSAMVYNAQKSLQMAQRVGMPNIGNHALGGIIGSIGSTVKKGAEKAVDIGKAGLQKAESLALKPADAALSWALHHFIPKGGMFLDVAKNLAGKIRQNAVNALKGVLGVGSGSGNGGGSGHGDMSAHSASAAKAQAYAKTLLGSFGWGTNQMSSLISLWNGESGWNNLAANPTSTAFGIAQFLNGTWAGKKFPKTTNYMQQIFDGMQYIKGSYGNPSNAFSQWSARSPHWYDNGGLWYPGTMGMNQQSKGSKPEKVLTDEQFEDMHELAQRGMSGGQTINVYTQEINPIKHAADLGWELQRRVG